MVSALLCNPDAIAERRARRASLGAMSPRLSAAAVSISDPIISALAMITPPTSLAVSIA
jgi:hypothetical protein